MARSPSGKALLGIGVFQKGSACVFPEVLYGLTFELVLNLTKWCADPPLWFTADRCIPLGWFMGLDRAIYSNHRYTGLKPPS